MESLATFPSLHGRTAFVTGGGSGIGAAIVTGLVRNGANVVFNDIDRDAAATLVSSLPADHVAFRHTDVTDTAALKSDIEFAHQEFGRLDVLVNNVANDTRHDLLEMDEAAYRKNLAVNLDPAVFATRAAVPLMEDGGAIINFSSLNIFLGPADIPIYTMSKAGLIGFTKSTARAFGNLGIRVNAIIPGWVSTDRQKSLWLTEEAESEWRRQCALDVEITAEDVANLVLFLAADDSSKITGQSFTIDAGRT